jgi:hypothetical protein
VAAQQCPYLVLQYKHNLSLVLNGTYTQHSARYLSRVDQRRLS